MQKFNYLCQRLIFLTTSKTNSIIYSMGKDRLLTPTEILERNPKLSKFWDARQIGYLLYCKLVKGKKLPRGCLLIEREVLDIYDQWVLRNDNT